MFPDGEAARLLSQLQMPCAHCGGAFHEPLTMAAKRHRRDPRAVLEAFRALESGGPDRGEVEAALARVRLGRDCEPLRERRVERARAERLVGDLDLGVARRHNGRDDRVASSSVVSGVERVLRELDAPSAP